MAWVYISIGSNIEPERHIRAGLAELRRRFGPLTVSTVYANPAVGFAGDDFLNLVTGFETGLPVRTVAADLRDIERSHGHRDDGPKFGPRALDLDLLLYDDLALCEDGLCIPRAEILRHAFVLKPLAEVAGNRRHPLLDRTFADLWATFDQSRETLIPVALEFEET
jgi:2-amino-4-hydroxy-6-hydroxymethyldihydropteridine diphosphokinase